MRANHLQDLHKASPARRISTDSTTLVRQAGATPLAKFCVSPDSPWCRLPLTLPLAFITCLIGIYGLTSFAEHTPANPPETPPIAVSIVELPHEPSPPAQPQPAPVQTMTHTPIKPTPTPTPPHPTNPMASTPTAAPSTPSPAPPPPQVSSTTTTTHGNPTANSGARALVRPLPNIPDDLPDEAIHTSVLARFHVAADGSATVELIQATSNPRLNRLWLNALSHWQFFPAIRDGNPVASVIDIKAKVD